MSGRTTIRGWWLVAGLAAIVVLAAVPYVAVTMLHARRLEAVEAAVRAIAAQVASQPPGPEGAAVLIGPGSKPQSRDPEWLTRTTAPLTAATTADPWGNAFLVNIGAPSSATVWVMSAGADGVIDTPFVQSGLHTLGDDVAWPARR